jgi:hypothetical protein
MEIINSKVKKIKWYILIICSACLICFTGSIFWEIINDIASGKGRNDLDKVKIDFKMHQEDVAGFCSETNNNLLVEYTKNFDGMNHFSLFIYKKDLRMILRNISSYKADLERFYNISFASTKVDTRIGYDVEELGGVNYKVALSRAHKVNTDLILDGEHIVVLKHNKDTLQIHGEFYNISFGKKDNYVNEGLYIQDESFLNKPVEMELLLVNKSNGLNLLLVFSDQQMKIQEGITNELK